MAAASSSISTTASASISTTASAGVAITACAPVATRAGMASIDKVVTAGLFTPARQQCLKNKGLVAYVLSYLMSQHHDEDQTEIKIRLAAGRTCKLFRDILIPKNNLELYKALYPFLFVKNLQEAQAKYKELDCDHNCFYLRSIMPGAVYRICKMDRVFRKSIPYCYPLSPAHVAWTNFLESKSKEEESKSKEAYQLFSFFFSKKHSLITLLQDNDTNIITKFNGEFKNISFVFSHKVLIPSDSNQQMQMIDKYIQLGYPEITCKGFTSQNAQILNELNKALKSKEERLASLAPPVPNSKSRSDDNGGDNNLAIYQSEYRKAVAFFWNALENRGAPLLDHDIEKWIEALGPRRQRMAKLGHLIDTMRMGMPADKEMCTLYTPGFELYGSRIKQKYGASLPLVVKYKTHTGEEIELTTISTIGWQHGGYRYRAQGIKELVYLTKKVLEKKYATRKELAPDLHQIYWLFAHLAPWLRGTPTISGIFIDALWLVKGYAPPAKYFDENCEALVFDKWQEFSEMMLKHLISRENCK